MAFDDGINDRFPMHACNWVSENDYRAGAIIYKFCERVPNVGSFLHIEILKSNSGGRARSLRLV